MTGAPYVVIAGSIGVGKSTLLDGLLQQLAGSVGYREERESFLAEFYQEPAKHAFTLQLAYSLQYLQHSIAIHDEQRLVIQDRSIWDTHHVFSRWRRELGFISAIEFQLLNRIVEICEMHRKPDLFIMLDADVQTSLERIRARKLKEEAISTADCLQHRRVYFGRWFASVN